MMKSSKKIDLSTFASNNQDADRIGVSSTKGMLWEIGQYLPDRFRAVKDAHGLRVRISTGSWVHIRVIDVSPTGLHGYRYALALGTTSTEHGFVDDEERILESDMNARFQPDAVRDAVQDALNGAISNAEQVPA